MRPALPWGSRTEQSEDEIPLAMLRMCSAQAAGTEAALPGWPRPAAGPALSCLLCLLACSMPMALEKVAPMDCSCSTA